MRKNVGGGVRINDRSCTERDRNKNILNVYY